jgi:subfamily B ATP-binding cassette protein MsbA
MPSLDAIFRRIAGRDSPLFPFARKYAWSVPVVAGLGFAASLLEGLGISLVVPMLALISNDAPSRAGTGIVAQLYYFPSLIPEHLRLPAIAALILISIALKGVVQGANGILIAWIDGKAAHDIRVAMADRLLSVGYPFFLSTSSARLLNVLGTESWRASDAVRLIFTIVSGVGTLVVFCVLLMLVNWQLFIITLLGALALRWLQRAIVARVGIASEAMRQANEELADRIVAVTSGAVKIARIFGQEHREHVTFTRVSEFVRHTMLRIYRVSAWHHPLFELSYAGLFLVILCAASQIGLEIPVLIAFLLLMYRMQPYIHQVSGSFVALSGMRASVAEVEWMLEPNGKPRGPKGDLPFVGLKSGIRFQNVRFSYDAQRRDEEALSNVNFEIRQGIWTALDGPSGAGKSTIVNLLCRLIEPTSGRIDVDGQSITDISSGQWLSHLALAGQDLDLVQGTIAENIAYGAPDVSIDEIRHAAWLASLDEFVDALPAGYDTRVGERGFSVSGGQRQRIGLARALVRHPSILILDEATNALDALTEAVVMDRVKQASQGLTVLVISHRASTLRHCEASICIDRSLARTAILPVGAEG